MIFDSSKLVRASRNSTYPANVFSVFEKAASCSRTLLLTQELWNFLFSEAWSVGDGQKTIVLLQLRLEHVYILSRYCDEAIGTYRGSLVVQPVYHYEFHRTIKSE